MEAETIESPVRRKAKTDEAARVGFVGLKLGALKDTLEAAAAENNMALSELCREILEDGVENYGVNHGVELLKSCEATKAAAKKAATSGMEPEAIVDAHHKLTEIREILPKPPRSVQNAGGYLFRRRRFYGRNRQSQ